MNKLFIPRSKNYLSLKVTVAYNYSSSNIKKEESSLVFPR